MTMKASILIRCVVIRSLVGGFSGILHLSRTRDYPGLTKRRIALLTRDGSGLSQNIGRQSPTEAMATTHAAQQPLIPVIPFLLWDWARWTNCARSLSSK